MAAARWPGHFSAMVKVTVADLPESSTARRRCSPGSGDQRKSSLGVESSGSDRIVKRGGRWPHGRHRTVRIGGVGDGRLPHSPCAVPAIEVRIRLATKPVNGCHRIPARIIGRCGHRRPKRRIVGARADHQPRRRIFVEAGLQRMPHRLQFQQVTGLFRGPSRSVREHEVRLLDPKGRVPWRGMVIESGYPSAPCQPSAPFPPGPRRLVGETAPCL